MEVKSLFGGQPGSIWRAAQRFQNKTIFPSSYGASKLGGYPCVSQSWPLNSQGQRRPARRLSDLFQIGV